MAGPISPTRPQRRKPAVTTENALLLALLRAPQGLSAAELARATRLSQPTVKKALDRLTSGEDLYKEGKRWFANPDTVHVIGISIQSFAEPRQHGGGFNLSWSVSGIVTNRAAEETGIEWPDVECDERDCDISYRHVVDEVARTITHLRVAAEQSGYSIGAVGVEVGGHIDARPSYSSSQSMGRVVFSPNLGWRDKPLGRDLADKTGIPTFIENDANAFALWERFNPERPSRFAVVLLSESIGGAIIDKNQLLHGSTGGAGEIGHLPFVEDGELCTCGRVGCVATVGSEMAIRKEASGLGNSDINWLVDEAESGAVDPRDILDKAARALSRSIVSVCCVVEPDEVIITSTALEGSPFFQSRLKAHVAETLFESLHPKWFFVRADLRHAAAGAAWAAIIHDARWPALPPLEAAESGTIGN